MNEYNFYKEEWKKTSYIEPISVLVKYTITPFGKLFYPVLLVNNYKALRPSTIDGYFTDGKNIILKCMVSSDHEVKVVFNKPSDYDEIESKIFSTWYDATLYSADNPFNLDESIEFNNGYIALYHHTNKKAYKLIMETKYFLNSKWNFQGTNKFEEYGFIYFTNLKTIRNMQDLMKIGMRTVGSEIGVISDIDEEAYIKVYREEVKNRNRSIKVWIKPEMLHLNSIILHKTHTTPLCTVSDYYSWIEIFCSSIYRVIREGDATLKVKRVSKNEVMILDEDEIYEYGFLAGLGYKIEDLKMLWSENLIEMKELRPKELKEWKQLWEINYATLASKLTSEFLNKLKKR